MDSALVVHRLHFAFTITFHYLYPQLKRPESRTGWKFLHSMPGAALGTSSERVWRAVIALTAALQPQIWNNFTNRVRTVPYVLYRRFAGKVRIS